MRHLIFLLLVLTVAMAGCSGDSNRQSDSQGQAAVEEQAPAEGSSPAEVQEDQGGQQAAPPAEENPAPTHEERTEEKAPEPDVQMMPIVKGRGLTAYLDSALSTETDKAGRKFTATMKEPVNMKMGQALPAGCTLHGEVVLAERAARMGGKAKMTLEFNQLITPEGKTYRIFTEPLILEGEASAQGDVEKVVGGAVGGAIIGGILGGKDGAVKGGAAGGAAGGVWAVATRGKDIVLEEGQGIEVTLARDLRVPVTMGS